MLNILSLQKICYMIFPAAMLLYCTETQVDIPYREITQSLKIQEKIKSFLQT